MNISFNSQNISIARYLNSGKAYLDLLRKLGGSRLILSAGMPRSGSTLLFNILRLALADEEHRVVSGWIGDINGLPDGDTYLIKVHHIGWHRALRAKAIFYSYRDIRDALVSNKRKFGDASIEIVHQWIRDFNFAQKHAIRMIRYEDMMQSLPSVILGILDDIESSKCLDEILNNLPRENAAEAIGPYSKESLLHDGHRTNTARGDWRNVLDNNLQREIHSHYGWWLESNGYDV